MVEKMGKNLSGLMEELEATLRSSDLALREATLLVREYENTQKIPDPLREYALEALPVDETAPLVREREQKLFLDKFVIAYDMLSEVKEPGLPLDRIEKPPVEVVLGAAYAYALRQVGEGMTPGEVAQQVREALGTTPARDYPQAREEDVFQSIHWVLREYRDVDPGALERLKPVVETLREELFRGGETKEVKEPSPRMENWGPRL